MTVYRRNPLLMTVMGANPPRRRRPDDAIDEAIGQAWPRLMHGVQVPIMDIPKIFRDVKLEMAAGVPLDQAVLSVGRQYQAGGRRINPGGLGAAVVGGIAGAVTNRVLQSNPQIQVPGDLIAACDAILRCKACWSARPYAEAILRGDTGVDDPKHVLLYLRSNLGMWRGTEARIVRQVVDKYIKQGLSTFSSNPRGSSVLISTPSQLEAGKVAGWLRREKVDALVDVHRGEWGVFVPPNQFGRARHALNRVLSKNPSRHRRGSTRPASNPGRSTRKTTMPIARFAALVKKQNDPALWRDFVAKCKAYHKWSHGSWPTKVSVERIAKPGVKGLWITFDMGKQPESTYIMPKGSKRKGAWKHPWDRMPQMRGDPQAGMIITKLGGGNRLTNFLHG